MSTNPLTSLSGSYIQSLINTAVGSVSSAIGLTGSSGSGSIGATSLSTPQDQQQLSPFAQVMSTLQQLQESDPSKYQQVTQEIAKNLQSAANTAQANGNTAAAGELNQLATDFTSASQNGQLPNVQDLAQALGGGGGHHHHHHVSSSSADADSNSSSSGSSASNSSSNSSTSSLSQMLAAFQANAAQNNSLNPAAIIFNTLSGAGLLSNS